MIRVLLIAFGGYILLTSVAPFRSGGPAAANGEGYTGAPCDNFRTCRSCHLQSATYGPTTENLRLFDPMTGEEVFYFTPGVTYDVEVEVIKSRGGFALYGFQATAIGEDSLDIGKWIQPGNLTQIVQINNFCEMPRTYIEHTMPSGSNTFTAKWIAPSTSTGVVSFHISSNVVNGNGDTSGDSGSPGSIFSVPSAPPSHLILSDSISMGTYIAKDSLTALAPI